MSSFIQNRKRKHALRLINALINLFSVPKKLIAKKVDLKTFKPKKILALRLDYIGDVVMTSPALNVLRKKFPDAKILLITNTISKDFFDADTAVDEVLTFNWPWPYHKSDNLFTYPKFKDLVLLIRRLRSEQIDMLVDFRGDLRFIILFGVLAGIKVRISNSRSGRTDLLAYSSIYDFNKHEVERAVDIVRCLDINTQEIRPKFVFHREETRIIIEKFKQETGLSYPAKIAIVAPYSSKDVKSWPPEYFIDVITYLKNKGYVVLVAGTKGEATDAEKLLKNFDGSVYSFAGKTTVREMAALIAVSNIIVGIDTGVLHLAACFNIPIVAIFGPTRAIEFSPYSPNCTVVDLHSCRCNQFMHLKCDYPQQGYAECLYQLKPERVIKVIEEVLQAKSLDVNSGMN